MSARMIGYLYDGIDRPGYLSLETPVFEDAGGVGVVQVIDHTSGIVKDFEEVNAPSIALIPTDPFNKIITVDLQGECIYLAKYNDRYFAEVKSRFIPKLARWAAHLQLSYLNQFSLFVLFNIRYKAYCAAEQVIIHQELPFPKLTLKQFSIPDPLPVSNSSLTLKEIMLFYAQLMLAEKNNLSFEWLLQSFPEDYHTVSLNKQNKVVIGNYVMNINALMEALCNLNDDIGYAVEDRLVLRFQRCFLVVMDKLDPAKLAPGQLFEAPEYSSVMISAQAARLQFNPALLQRLKMTLKIKWKDRAMPLTALGYAELDKHFFQPAVI
jgi:hypothetical protein